MVKWKWIYEGKMDDDEIIGAVMNTTENNQSECKSEQVV